MSNIPQYHFKLQRIDVQGERVYDIENESSWRGLRYSKATGLYDIGRAKNIYTEEYAESDRKRVFLPEDGNYVNEGTVVTMTFLVLGDAASRHTTITNFEDYIRVGIHRYWDDARYAQFDFIVTEEIKVSDEKWVGAHPYVEIEVKMQNLNGRTTNVRPQ